jgi:hypothetical protein
MVVRRAHLMAVMVARLGLRHPRAQGDDERQGGDGGFHRLAPRQNILGIE